MNVWKKMRNYIFKVSEKNVAITWIFGTCIIYSSTCVSFLIFTRTLYHFRVLDNYKHLVLSWVALFFSRSFYIIQDAFVDDDDDAFYTLKPLAKSHPLLRGGHSIYMYTLKKLWIMFVRTTNTRTTTWKIEAEKKLSFITHRNRNIVAASLL